MIQSQTNSPSNDPAELGFEPADNGHVWFDRRFQVPLRRAGLTGFEQIMARTDARCEKILEDREVWHLRVRAADDKSQGLYLKKHHVWSWVGKLRALLGIRPAPTPAQIEAKNVAALSAQGIAVMRLIAYGERLRSNGLQESFVISEELENYSELHHYLRRRYALSPLGRRSDRDRDLMRLVGDIARIVRRLHEAGYNHRDLYCCHFFVQDKAPAEREIRLIDLQRVQRRRWFRRRWLVKDLAQLAWSAPSCCIKPTHKMAFIREYLGVAKLSPADKRLVRSVLLKQRRMERRLGNDN
jgi:lipopolysaccharide core heptose(I) kinase